MSMIAMQRASSDNRQTNDQKTCGRTGQAEPGSEVRPAHVLALTRNGTSVPEIDPWFPSHR